MSEQKPRFPWGGSCRHFTGIQNKVCKEGVVYKDLPRAANDGNPHLPCLRLVDGATWCAKWHGKTPDEMQAEEDAAMRDSQYMLDAMTGIHETKLQQGSIPCPRCLGVLRFSFASNKHIRANCETPHCLSFMS
jgi:hypothetical protein